MRELGRSRTHGYHVLWFCIVFYFGTAALAVVLLRDYRIDYPLVLLDTTESFSSPGMKEVRLRLPRNGLVRLEISGAASGSLSTHLVSREEPSRRATVWREFELAPEFTIERAGVTRRSGYLDAGEYWLRIVSRMDVHQPETVRVRIEFTPA